MRRPILKISTIGFLQAAQISNFFELRKSVSETELTAGIKNLIGSRPIV